MESLMQNRKISICLLLWRNQPVSLYRPDAVLVALAIHHILLRIQSAITLAESTDGSWQQKAGRVVTGPDTFIGFNRRWRLEMMRQWSHGHDARSRRTHRQ
jgi:hypothetical protein